MTGSTGKTTGSTWQAATGTSSRLLGQALRILLIVGLILMSPGSGQLALALAQPPADPAAQLDRLDDFAREVQDSLDRTSFDLDALAFELAFEEPETIVEWVRTNIAFEQYPGLLRGAEGTLLSRAGNALDQAVLLASLLGDAGYDARVVTGQLELSEAQELLREMRPSEPAEGGSPDGPGSSSNVALTLGMTDTEFDSLVETAEEEFEVMLQESRATADRLTGVLAESGLTISGPSLDELVEEARDYAWVEFRDLNGDWQAAHVAFREPPVTLEELAPDVVLEQSVPAELQHRFRFQVFIEQRLGDELVSKPIMEAWERPVANLTGFRISYMNMPDGSDDSVEMSLEEMVDATNFFVPVFGDVLAPGAMHFDLDGNAVDALAAGNQAAGVFGNIADAFGQAAGQLAGEDPDEFVALTAQWFEYTLIEPGGRETTHRRYVFDRIGPENREAGVPELDPEVTEEQVIEALLRSHTIMLAPGDYPLPYITDRTLTALGLSVEYLRELQEFIADPNGRPPVPPLEVSTALDALPHLQMFSAMEDLPQPDDVLSYRPAPTLAVVERGVSGGSGMVDVIANQRRSFRVTEGGMPQPETSRNLLAGVWETRVEGTPLRAPEGTTTDAFAALEAAEREGIELIVLAPGDGGRVARLNVPDASVAAIREDLAAGYAVVLPVDQPSDLAEVGWWRVHAVTGETLGRLADGRGGQVAEDIGIRATIVSSMVSMFFGLVGAIGCYQIEDAQQSACCLAENVGYAAVGFGVGVFIGLLGATAALSIAAGAVYDVGTFGLGQAGLLLTFCGSSGRLPGESTTLACLPGHGGTFDAPESGLIGRFTGLGQPAAFAVKAV